MVEVDLREESREAEGGLFALAQDLRQRRPVNRTDKGGLVPQLPLLATVVLQGDPLKSESV